MSLVIRVINFIVARALNDRQFKTLLDEVNNYPGLLLHSNVRWLSRGKVLSRFAACLNEIRTFLEMKGVGHPELADTEWLLKFYYLVDLTEHLNQLNVKMQGIGNTVLSLQQAVFAFENKLELFITDLETGRLLHFEKLSQFKDACTASEPIQNLDLHQLAGCTSSLLQSFKARFGEFREHTRLFKFITHPNECSLNTADLNYIPGVSVRDFEAEVADLKASDMWVNKFKSLNEDLERITRQKAELASKHMWTEMKKLQPEDQLILKTWNALPVTYHTLQRLKEDNQVIRSSLVNPLMRLHGKWSLISPEGRRGGGEEERGRKRGGEERGGKRGEEERGRKREEEERERKRGEEERGRKRGEEERDEREERGRIRLRKNGRRGGESEMRGG
ncbi:hypothetical protein NHX12_008771 [Muraenolepis orangiensis]|uniref:General transcription factor II-I repeat domain-containing protein 2A n=1 Tax=Muraenolepis orangiensis TaxID=630683 RepID=A0A9Q0DNQ8_9TELE|nr:hypothetical protein NHX12_008771 [Muraenolepis orangiensis]